MTMISPANLILSAVLGCSCMLATNAFASDDARMYEITITNLTRMETFTPILAASHTKGHPLFQLGEAPSTEIAAIAESGNVVPLQDMLIANGAYDTISSGTLLKPGKTTTLTLMASEKTRFFSIASMLIPTNDAFFAVNGMKLPKKKYRMQTVMVPAYDAGSEPNDELCANMPGPDCGGTGLSPDAGGEGYVHVHAGIHGIGDLLASEYDWRNPVAQVKVVRVR